MVQRHPPASAACRLEHLIGLGETGDKRLLTEHVRPSGEGAETVLGVAGRRCPDDENLRLADGYHLVEIFENRNPEMLSRSPTATGVEIRCAHDLVTPYRGEGRKVKRKSSVAEPDKCDAQDVSMTEVNGGT
jgi:hypothetical protein